MVDLPQLNVTLGYLLRRSYAKLQSQVYEGVRMAGFADLREAHSGVLRHLGPEGTRMVDLARLLGITKQSVTYLVDDLSALGYVETAPDPMDRRAKLVRYTVRGRELAATLLEQSARVEQECARKLGADRMAALRATLVLLAEET